MRPPNLAQALSDDFKGLVATLKSNRDELEAASDDKEALLRLSCTSSNKMHEQFNIENWWDTLDNIASLWASDDFFAGNSCNPTRRLRTS